MPERPSLVPKRESWDNAFLIAQMWRHFVRTIREDEHHDRATPFAVRHQAHLPDRTVPEALGGIMAVVGVDACRGGWFAVRRKGDDTISF